MQISFDKPLAAPPRRSLLLRHRWCCWLLVFMQSFSLTLAAHAQQTYPTRAVRVVVPWPAGHSADIIARIMAPKLQAGLGQSFYVDNMGGAAGVIGFSQVKTAAPDGQTLLVTSGGPVILAPLFLKNLSYDPVKDFTAVGLLGWFGVMLVARPGFPAKNINELVSYVRAHPGEVTFSSTGATSFNRLMVELLMRTLDLRMTHVPYRGEPESLSAVMSGTVDIGFAGVAACAPLVNAKRVKGIALATPARSPLAPEVPTFKESGIPELQTFGEGGTQIFIGMFTPAKTPASTVQALNTQLTTMAKDPAFRADMERQGVTLVGPTSSEAFGRIVKDNIALWKKVIDEAHITAE
jgi:tripartite-type tricarboxylate transporter receptor subunit TctC